jgi:hypothetical protein
VVIMTMDDPKVTAEKDAADIRAILGAVSAAYRAKDAQVIGRHYLPGARIADLALPLLRHGFDAEAVQTWLDGWDGPVETVTRDLVVEVDGDLAVARGDPKPRRRGRRLVVAHHPHLRPQAPGLADHPRARVGAVPHGRQLPGGRGPRTLSRETVILEDTARVPRPAAAAGGPRGPAPMRLDG